MRVGSCAYGGACGYGPCATYCVSAYGGAYATGTRTYSGCALAYGSAYAGDPCAYAGGPCAYAVGAY